MNSVIPKNQKFCTKMMYGGRLTAVTYTRQKQERSFTSQTSNDRIQLTCIIVYMPFLCSLSLNDDQSLFYKKVNDNMDERILLTISIIPESNHQHKPVK